VFLGRYPIEAADPTVERFYQALLPVLTDPTFHTGDWQLCTRAGWPGDDGYQELISWCWTGAARWLIVVNLTDHTAAGLIRTPWPDMRGQTWQLTDPTQQTTYTRSGDDLVDGLFVRLRPKGWHLFRVDPSEATTGQSPATPS
jgi:hypothetical protein